MDDLTEKQLRERMRWISDKIEAVWKEIEPKLAEFHELRVEFNEVIAELMDRGFLDEEQTPPVEGSGEAS